MATPSVSYTYDAIYPRVATMVDGTGTTSYSYHAAGQPGAGQVASVDGPLANDTITYGYDALGRVTTRAINGAANTVTWAFDALGRATAETNVLGTFTSTYDGPTSRLATVTYPNGQTSTYSYLAATQERRLQTIHHQYPNAATLSKFDYTYDPVGNILTWQQQADSAAPTLWRYGYDRADQLVRASQETTGGMPTVLHEYAYGYDPAGNRLYEQIDTDVTAWTYTNLNRLQAQAGGGVLQLRGSVNEPATVTVQGVPAAVSSANQFQGGLPVVPGTNVFTVTATDGSGNVATAQYEVDVTSAPKTFTYDANGNLTSDGTRTFEWNALNQLAAINLGTERSEFEYDGLQRRVRQEEKENGVTTADTRVLWCETVICEERAADGVTVTRRPFGLGEQITGAAHYFTTDHLGSVREVADTAGMLLARYAFDPWGRRAVAQGTDVTSVGFTGGRSLDGTRVLTMFRLYDASIGRWLSEDPLTALMRDLAARSKGGFPAVAGATHQAYFFTGNRPVTLVDDLGAAPQPPSTGRDCTSRSPVCESYAPCDHYMYANAKCFCRCAGNSQWSSLVRCCLVDARSAGYSMEGAHRLCYALAMLRHPTSVSPPGLGACYRNCVQAQAMCGCS